MNKRFSDILHIIPAFLILFTGLSTSVHAVDGVIEINAARAAAGGVTASDTPGFPVTIDTAGSYRLTGNLNPVDASGIVVTADDVTIDLNGFTIKATISNVGIDYDGIDSVARQRITVLNGIVQEFSRNGLSLGGTSRVSGVRAFNNGSRGIDVGPNSIVTDSTASDNDNVGIYVGPNSIVTGNTASHNGSHGIQNDVGPTVVVGNTARFNDGSGFAVSGTIKSNVATFNGAHGISAGSGSAVIGNSVNSNTGFGINLGAATFSGYSNNVILSNTGGTVNGGVEMPPGSNVCDGGGCP